MKKLWIFLLIALLVAGCSVTFDFDGAMIERFTNKISYLYANCWSDIEWLQETMTPETIQNMDQTCAASIKAITKIKGKIEKLKWRIWESEALNKLLAKIDEILNSLQNSKDQIKNYSSNIDISGLVNQVNKENLIWSLESLAQEINR